MFVLMARGSKLFLARSYKQNIANKQYSLDCVGVSDYQTYLEDSFDIKAGYGSHNFEDLCFRTDFDLLFIVLLVLHRSLHFSSVPDLKAFLESFLLELQEANDFLHSVLPKALDEMYYSDRERQDLSEAFEKVRERMKQPE